MTRISSRFRWDLTPNRLTQRAAAQGKLLDLTSSNPTAVGLPPPADLVLAPLRDERALRYRPDPRGLRETREAVCAYYAGHGAVVHPDDVFLTASTSEAYAWLFKLLADPGDEILVPRPSYPLFDFLAGLELVTLYPYPAGERSLAMWRTEKTRAAVAVHPNNPTGAWVDTLDPDGLPLLIDEVFLDYPLSRPGATHAGRDQPGDVFILSGLSKICALPQMKLGWIVLSGAARRPELRDWLEVIADSYLSASTPVQWAAIEWLRHRHEMTAGLKQRLERNGTAARQVLGERAQNMEAGWSQVIRLDEDADEESTVMKLLEEGLLVQPGYFYDYEFPALVVSLLTPEPDFFKGLEKIHSSLFS